VPVPGWTAEHEWDGFIPFEELPSQVDPGTAYLVSANDRNHADDYLHLIGKDFHTPDRAARITELLEARDDHTVDTCREIQGDTVSLAARALLPRISLSDERARDLFDGWDHDLSADSAAAALWEVFIDELARRAVDGKELLVAEYLTDRELFRSRALPALLDADLLSRELLDQALAAAWDRCADAMGPDPAGWRWGDIHRARFAHPLGRMPGLEPLFVAAEHPLGGDEQTVNKAGFEGAGPFDVCVIPSWRVVYDLANLDDSMGILPTGQSGDPASPHWNDQTTAWAAGELRPLPFSRAAVEAAATERLTILPG
jgi:penicillin amidase